MKIEDYPQNYLVAIDVVLEHEGGFVIDHGGATNWGMSLRTLRNQGDWDGDGLVDADIDGDGDIDADDIRLLTREDAIRYYFLTWWRPLRYDRIDYAVVSSKVMDLAVNMGPKPAHRILQRACRACRKDIDDDGTIGRLTLAAANDIVPDVLRATMRSEAAGFYRRIAAVRTVRRRTKPSLPDFEQYLNGWLKRGYW